MIDRDTIQNPFDRDVVSDPTSPSQTDVPHIHRQAFDLCTSSYNRVAGQRYSWSVLLYGEAGCGKTHLLARFRKWLASELETKPIIPPALFVAVRMETGPGQVWRHLRRRFAEELTRRLPGGSTPLELILQRFAMHYGADLSRAFENAPLRDTSIDLMNVFGHYASGHFRLQCRAWLSGDGLSDADLLSLNLSQSSASSIEEDSAESEARRIILAITRICAPDPVVFCFDEIEALNLSQQLTSFGSFCRVGASLVDESNNSLLISTVLLAFLNDLRQGSAVTDFQRISKETADLQPLDWDLGQQLIAARLSSASELANHHPISEKNLRAFYAAEHGRVTPRRLIHEARRLFAAWQHKPEPAHISPQDFLRTEFDRLWNSSPLRTSSNTTGDVLSHGLPVALELLGSSLQKSSSKHSDVTASSKAGPISIAFGNQTNMNSFGPWLRRLQAETPLATTLRILRDARLPVSPGAKAVQSRLQEIESSNGKLIRVDAEALAALDAMRRLLSVATSGDLSLSGATIEPTTVRQWLAKNLPDEITTLVEQLAGNASPSTPLEPEPDALFELLHNQKVIPLEEAARLTQLPREQIENYARTHPHRIGLFGGTHPVVSQAIPASAQGEAHDTQ